MTEKKSAAIPYLTMGLGIAAALLTAGAQWMVSKTSEIPGLIDRQKAISKQVDDHEDRIRHLERRRYENKGKSNDE